MSLDGLLNSMTCWHGPFKLASFKNIRIVMAQNDDTLIDPMITYMVNFCAENCNLVK